MKRKPKKKTKSLGVSKFPLTRDKSKIRKPFYNMLDKGPDL